MTRESRMRGARVGLWVLVLLAGPAAPVSAHTGQPPAPHDIWSAWSWEPAILLGLALVALLYGAGVRDLWRRAGVGRGVSRWQAAAFAGGWLALLVALVSPLDALGTALFAAHMVQHLVLMLVAAPLLVLGAPPVALAWAVPRGWRREVGRWHERWPGRAWHTLAHPAVVWGVYAVTLWLWHVPGLYETALRNEWVHAVEHAAMLGAALLFWWVLVRAGSRGRLNQGAAVLFVFTTALHGGLLGVLLTFAPTPWYPIYAARTPAWGLAPLQDQQLAGAIMWVPPGVVYLVTALALFTRWLQHMERQDAAGADRV